MTEFHKFGPIIGGIVFLSLLVGLVPIAGAQDEDPDAALVQMIAELVRDADRDHTVSTAEMALEMRRWVAERSVREGWNLQLRIGLNRGPAVGGIIGTTKFMYDLWGDTVNTAARMESFGEPGQIQVTRSVYEQLKDDYVLEARGPIEVKGKGILETWFLESAMN